MKTLLHQESTEGPAAAVLPGTHVPSPRATGGETSTLKLISALCQALARQRVTYCHWKSNDALERSATGDNDLDLLVLNDDLDRFLGVLCQLGFKQAQSPPDRDMPGVLDYFGYDQETGRIVHVHAHFRLVIGDDRSKNYRLPIERAYLAETTQRLGFPIPRPEIEFVVFVIRMMLKHCSWDAVLWGKGRLKAAVRSEFEHLRVKVNMSDVNHILRRHLPLIDTALFGRCVRSLEPGTPLWSRVSTAWRLQSVLDAHTRRPYWANVGIKMGRALSRTLRRRIRSCKARRRLSSGGAIIAIVGGDGAGKSTAVASVGSWLGSVLATQECHFGKPPKAWMTRLVSGCLKVRKWCGFRARPDEKQTRFPGYLAVMREVCRARDRYRQHVRARRFANQGGVVICDRFPTPEIRSMDNARIAGMTNMHRRGRLLECLLRREQAYYAEIRPPELLLVLRLDPDVAIQRRSDEDPSFVHARSSEIWRLDESQLAAHFVDASRAKEEVLADVRQLIWSSL